MTSSPADIALVPVDATANPASEQDSSILDPNNSEEGDHDAGYTRPWKGKEREVEMVEEEEPDDDDKVEKLDYPPTNEEDAETRRIEEVSFISSTLSNDSHFS